MNKVDQVSLEELANFENEIFFFRFSKGPMPDCYRFGIYRALEKHFVICCSIVQQRSVQNSGTFGI